MKKVLHISMAIVYLLLTIGIQISTHYCGNYAIDVDFISSIENAEPAGCCGDVCETSCCTTNIQNIQIHELHQRTPKYEHKWVLTTDIIRSGNYLDLYAEKIPAQDYSHTFHSPPQNKANILNCTFRI